MIASKLIQAVASQHILVVLNETCGQPLEHLAVVAGVSQSHLTKVKAGRANLGKERTLILVDYLSKVCDELEAFNHGQPEVINLIQAHIRYFRWVMKESRQWA